MSASSPAHAAEDAPPPNPPHKGEGLKRLNLPVGAIQRARRLRKQMTDAERALWHGLRDTLPHAHWRKQVPFGPYTADFCSHGAKLIIEVDGGQHNAGRDAVRTRFLEGEGYRVLRFWNNEVLQNLDGVLTVIADYISSPLVGEDEGGGRPTSVGQKTPSASSPANAAEAAPPSPSLPHKGGEGERAQP